MDQFGVNGWISLAGLNTKADAEIREYLAIQVPKVRLNLDEKLSLDFPEIKFLVLLISLTNDRTTSQMLKDKCEILKGSESYQLRNAVLTAKDELVIRVDKEEYPLSVAEILQDAQSHITRLFSLLIDKLENLGIASKEKLGNLFGLNNQAESNQVFLQLKGKYDEQLPLTNANQLAFVLLYKKYENPEADISTFSVQTKEIRKLDAGTIYCSEFKDIFVPEELRLNVSFSGLKSLLKLEKESSFVIPEGITVCSSFPLSGSDFHLFGMEKVTSIEAQISLVDYLFQKWQKVKDSVKTIQLIPERLKWIDLIGFNPDLAISAEQSLESENLPPFVQAWMEPGEKAHFLKSLGVNFGGSEIVEIRKYLSLERDEEINFRLNHSDTLLINTLQFIENKGITFSHQDKRIRMLKEVYAKITDCELSDLPLPVLADPGDGSVFLKRIEIDEVFFLDEGKLEQLNEKGGKIIQIFENSEKELVHGQILDDVTNSWIEDELVHVPLLFDLFETSFLNGELSEEWSREFYIQWKMKFPEYSIFLTEGHIPHCVTLDGTIIHEYAQGDYLGHENFVFVNKHLNDRSIIDLINKEDLLPEDAIDALKTIFQTYDNTLQDYISRIQSDPNLKQEWDRIQEKLKEDEKKRELTEEFGQATRYSKGWFIKLLDLMVMAGSNSDLNNPEGELTFNGLEFNPSDLRILTLKDPSRTISPLLDQYTDLITTFVWKDAQEKTKKKEIRLKGVCKKEGQKLSAIPLDSSDFSSVVLGKVVRVELRFSRVIELWKKLRDAFLQLHFDDSFNMKENLPENIQFIFGPPGTGKTTRITEEVLGIIRAKKDAQIIILTPTNKAADVLSKRILANASPSDKPSNWLVRYGISGDMDLTDKGLVSDSSTFSWQAFDKCVMVTTIHRFPYEKVLLETGPDGEEKEWLNDHNWDHIFFDEASMIPLPYVVFALFKRQFGEGNSLTQFWIGGDPLQIPPVVVIPDEDLPETEKDVREENIYSMISLNSFKKEDQEKIPRYGDKIINLDTQYRSVEIIGSLFSKFQYHDLLKHGRINGKGGSSHPRPLPEYFKNLGIRPITIVRYPVHSLETIYNPGKLFQSPFHLYSAFLINEMVTRFRKEAGKETWKLGVISPYRAQANLLNKMIEAQDTANSSVSVITDTVHGFQGDECDLVVVVFNPSSQNASYSRFLKKEFIINVAVSRAQDYLILFLPDEDTNGFDKLELLHKRYSNSILDIVNLSKPKDQVAIIKASVLEKALMGTEKYFEKNSFTNAHQSVNVYGEPELDYMVRLSGSAIDIHWKNKK